MPIYLRSYSIFLMLFLGSFATEQRGEDAYSADLVRTLLQRPAGVSFGFEEKQVNRLGDRLAIALLKVLDEDELKDPDKIRRILPLIHNSFVRPEIISIPEDRRPKITLFLLRYLSNVREPDIREQLTQLANFVKEKTAKYK